MKPRVLQLIDSFDEGGSERQAINLTRLLHESGNYEVFVASLKADGVLRAEIENLDLGQIAPYPLNSFYDLNAMNQLRRFVRQLRASEIDILHTHDFYTNIFGMVAGFLAGIPVRVASRRETSGMRSSTQQKAQRLAYTLAHRIVANSGAVRQKLIEERVSESKITVIHNGLELKRVTPPAQVSRYEALRSLGIQKETSARFITIVANMRHEVKDYPMFLRAAQQVSKSEPGVHFLLAGEGELMGSIRTVARELGIEDETTFLGRCENIAELLRVSEVCVLTSKAEGFSNAILEYMAASRAVVATDVGGAKEAIVEGKTGFLVPSGDDQTMANRIVSLLHDPEKTRTMGESGRRIVEQKFSLEAQLQNTERMYENLLANNVAATSLQVNGTRFVSAERTAKPLRVLIVAPSSDILGGQSVQAARLLVRLREEQTLAVGFLPINPRLPGVLRKLQAIKYVRTVLTSGLYVATLLLRVPRYDIIHVFSASYFSFVLAPTPAILIGKLYGKKVLLNYHSGEAADHLASWQRSAVPTIRCADRIAVPSKYLVGVFDQFGLHAKGIHNLIETDKFTFRERMPLQPVFFSNRNLEKHYGVDQVLRAFAIIQKHFPEASLTVAGDGNQRYPLEELAVHLELRNTNFVGQIEPDEIAKHYDNSDLYLNGSEIDNQPLSILEAFACGLPVVTTNAGGIPDIVTHEHSGLVVERGDHEAMAECALRLLQTPRLARSIAQRAREECRKYSWAAVRQQWMHLYDELTNGQKEQDTMAAEQEKSDFFEADHSELKKSRIEKLRGMTLDELRLRGSQALAIFAERKGWSSLAKLPVDRALIGLLNGSGEQDKGFQSVEDVLNHFRTRTSPPFFSAFAERDRTIAEWRNRWPEAEKDLIDQANRIIEGRFDLLGLRGISFGNPINWHLEPLSGKCAPRIHWSRLDYLNADLVGDKKITWELNRHQYFIKLGQAYWLTADEKYAQAFVAHIASWMDANPPKIGINWTSSLEIALRSISWLWALYFFKDSPELTSRTFIRIIKFLYLNARHLETYLSTYFSPNTHLTGEALGLFYLGTLLPEFKEANRWRTIGRQILIDELPRQVKSDGVYFEQSSYYHRYTTDFYTHLLILLRQSIPPAITSGFTETLNKEIEEKLKALLDHLMYIIRPDWTTPLFGDDDAGRLVTLDMRAANDFRAALSTGAVLFGRSDYKFVAREAAEETLWLLGSKALKKFDEIESLEPAKQSMAFREGGYYVMRDGWEPTSNYLLFDCGPHGADNCGHSHADAIAFELSAYGQTVLVDPGTYTYTGSKESRDWFRSSMAHNTLTIDGQSSSIPAGPFSWKTKARCEPLSWISQRRFDFAEGRHDGYSHLVMPAIHTRSILFLKNDYWVLRDRVASQGNHQADLWFHFAANVDSRLGRLGGEALVPGENGQNAGVQIVTFGENGRWSREDGWISHSYGDRGPGQVLRFATRISGAGELITFLLPAPVEALSNFSIREIETIGGSAFEIEKDNSVDLVMIRDASRGPLIETARMASDFEWTWARFYRSSNDVPSELLVLGGQRLELEGQEVLKSAARISYLVASRRGDQFHVETDDKVLDLPLTKRNLETAFSTSVSANLSNI